MIATEVITVGCNGMTDTQVIAAWVGVVLIAAIFVSGLLFWYTHGGREKW